MKLFSILNPNKAKQEFNLKRYNLEIFDMRAFVRASEYNKYKIERFSKKNRVIKFHVTILLPHFTQFLFFFFNFNQQTLNLNYHSHKSIKSLGLNSNLNEIDSIITNSKIYPCILI